MDKLIELANELKVGVDVLWQALIKQAGIDFFTTSIQYIIFIIIGVFLIKKIKELYLKILHSDTCYDEIMNLWVFIFIFGLCFIWIFCSCFYTLPNYVSSLINPQYWALEKISNLIK